jgi:sRNA-binding protein
VSHGPKAGVGEMQSVVEARSLGSKRAHNCETLNCYRHGAVSVAICGHPAGIYCRKCAAAWQRLFARELRDAAERREREALEREAALCAA